MHHQWLLSKLKKVRRICFGAECSLCRSVIASLLPFSKILRLLLRRDSTPSSRSYVGLTSSLARQT